MFQGRFAGGWLSVKTRMLIMPSSFRPVSCLSRVHCKTLYICVYVEGVGGGGVKASATRVCVCVGGVGSPK